MITNAQNALLVVSPSHLDCEQYFHPEAACLYYQDNEAAYRNITAVTMKASVEIDADGDKSYMRLTHKDLSYAQLIPLMNGTKVFSVSPDGKHRHVAFVTGPLYSTAAQFTQCLGRAYRANPPIEEAKLKALLGEKLKPIDSGTPAAE